MFIVKVDPCLFAQWKGITEFDRFNRNIQLDYDENSSSTSLALTARSPPGVSLQLLADKLNPFSKFDTKLDVKYRFIVHVAMLHAEATVRVGEI